MDLVDALIESEALKISPPGELFFYTSGTVGPYYINTHFLYGGPGPAQELLDFIDTDSEQPDFASNLRDRVQAQVDTDARYRAVIDELTASILEAEGDTPSMWISGGARRDWFFSVAVAEQLQRPHLYLFKDGSAVELDEEGELISVDSLDGATTVHVADLVTEASSYVRMWIPSIRDRDGEMILSANVVDRAQGGMDVMKDADVPALALLRVDEELFAALRSKGVVDAKQHETLTAYFDNPQAAMAAFLGEHPEFIQNSLAADDEKTVTRARQLVKQDPYDLGLSL
ncbi:MAG: orotate phosphoribosyltransferase [Gemmatimonadetes bacterium]|jgi:orotate phosphoribosyltransferase|nr:orotate phosphoribosyltransferase [Gemmatimonadota bacterium]MBT6145211.1 orotate phosphoribosyltransferase [Gemmatimonadota bacterium]